jgi:hypothetical protein
MASLQFDAQEVFRNIDRIDGGIYNAMKGGLDIGLIEAVDHIKVAYSRPTTGKGFTDRTGNLRNSLGHESQLSFGGVVGVIRAKMPYAPVVETRREGMYAFMWPGVMDMADNFLERIGDSVKLLLRS